MNTPQQLARRSRGFSLIELMVAVALGLLLTVAMAYAYINSKTAFSRQQQLSAIQQSVRIAFEYLSSDARTAGHLGCYTGSPTGGNCAGPFCNLLSTAALATNFGVGVEGYEYKNTEANKFTLTSSAPADETDAAKWETNVAAGAVNTIPLTTIAGAAGGLTPGSDVLVIRTASGRPVRLSANANVSANQAVVGIETTTDANATCKDGSAKVSGFCAKSYGLIASCSRARVFEVNTITAGTAGTPSTLNITGTLGNDPVYALAATEVFPVQTIAYYVKRSSSGTSTSLYRRIFDGDNASGAEQELIEGVESLQVKYGTDTSPATPDGAVDQYVAAKGATPAVADSVLDWSQVAAIRLSLLIRSTVPVEGDVALPTKGALNGVEITYPTTGARFDRRVFTTTVAVRNKIAYLAPVTP